MENRTYYHQEMVLNKIQINRVYDIIEKMRNEGKLKGEGGFVPMYEFSIRYQFTTIGVAKILDVAGQSFVINEEEMDMA